MTSLVFFEMPKERLCFARVTHFDSQQFVFKTCNCLCQNFIFLYRGIVETGHVLALYTLYTKDATFSLVLVCRKQNT